MPATIRFVNPDDATQIDEIYRPIVVNTATSFEYEPPTLDELRRRIESKSVDYPWLVCELDSRILGYAYGGRFRERAAYQWTVEVSVYVRAGFHRRGIARALYEALFCCLRIQGFHTLVAGVTLPNDASVILHDRMGFEPIGVFRRVGYKFGEWRDVGWYTLQLLPAAIAPRQPRTVAETDPLEECTEALRKAAGRVRTE